MTLMTNRGGWHLDRPFLALLVGLTAIGFIMLASASWPLGFDRFSDGYYFLKHQLIFGLLPGVVGCLVAMRVPYETFRRFAPHMLGLSILLLILVFVPGIGAEFGTSHSWIGIGDFSFQPSELVKLTFLIYLAAWLEKRSRHELKSVAAGLAPFLTVLGTIALLLILQPDTGTLGIIVLTAFAVYFVAGAPISHLVGLGLLGAGAMAMLLKFSEYRAARILTFMHPELDPLGIGYHINQALLAIGSGGLFGRGYGHSLQKFQYLPEVAGDSIFAVMAEEMGFILVTVFILLYVAFLFRGFKIAEQAPDAFGRYLVIGIMAWFGIQAFVNIGAMVGVMPITGVPLPFISYGGTALAISLTAAGVVLNVSGVKQKN
jgi:cell division protein FtsW